MSEPAEYLTAHIRGRLAEGGPDQLGVLVKVGDGRVVLAGTVESESARRAVCEAVAELASELEVCDELVVVDSLGPADHEDMP